MAWHSCHGKEADMWKVFAALFVCSCAIENVDPDPVHGAGGGDAASESSASAGGAGGVEPCDWPARPRPLRVVRAIASQQLEADTIVLAAVPEPQTLWLPSARHSPGAVVVVKEVRGVDRRLTVNTSGIDVFLGLGTVAHDTRVAWTSRTFMVVKDDDGAAAWMLLDAVE
jgi:hypothetical protein